MCEDPHHQRGSGCGWARCSYCKEEYWLRRAVGNTTFHYWPDAEYAYYGHCKDEKHQMVMRAMDEARRVMLLHINDNWNAIRASNKLFRTPEMLALRKVLK